MKRSTIILFFSLGVFLMQCKIKQDIPYEFPDAMIASAKIEFAKQCDKGKILYDINCAKCHNTVQRRKELIPDFTIEQLTSYEIRVSTPEHESNIPEMMVTAEELGYIMTFLSYKKKSGKVFIYSKEKHL